MTFVVDKKDMDKMNADNEGVSCRLSMRNMEPSVSYMMSATRLRTIINRHLAKQADDVVTQIGVVAKLCVS